MTRSAERQALQAQVSRAAADVGERDEEIARLEKAQAAHDKITAKILAKLASYQQKCEELQRELSANAAQLKSAEDRAVMLERLLNRFNHSAGSDQKEAATV